MLLELSHMEGAGWAGREHGGGAWPGDTLTVPGLAEFIASRY